MRSSNRALAAAFVGATLVLGGCSADQVAEEAAEQAIEAQGGGDVEIDADGDSFSVEGEDGSEFSVGNDEVPDDFPSQIPIPEGYAVEGSSSLKEQGKSGWWLNLVYADTTAADLADTSASEMTDAGFKEQNTLTADETTTAGYEGKGYQVTLTIVPTADGKGSRLTMTVAEVS